MSNTDGAAPAAADSGELTISQAVGILGQPPKKDNEPATPPPPAREERPDAVQESDEDAAADEDQPPGEADEDEAADDDLPPLKPHKALTAAEREVFESLPRLAQEAWNQRERDRDTFYRKGHDEAAASIRTAQERERAAEQARVQYEAALPQLFQQFSAQFQTEFQDIKTWDDVSTMRQNDPMRFMAWQEARDKGQTLQKEAYQAQERQQQEQSQRYQAYQSAESVKVEQYLAKEHAKLGPAKDVGDKVRAVLIDGYGFSDEELSASWHQGAPMFLADSRIQLMAIDAYAYRNAKQAAATATRKPVPPVQRPGTATNRGESQNVAYKIANDKLTRTGRIEDAVALLNLKSQRRR